MISIINLACSISGIEIWPMQEGNAGCCLQATWPTSFHLPNQPRHRPFTLTRHMCVPLLTHPAQARASTACTACTHSMHAQHTCIAYMHSIHAERTCTAYVHSTHAQHTCTAYMRSSGHNHDVNAVCFGGTFSNPCCKHLHNLACC